MLIMRTYKPIFLALLFTALSGCSDDSSENPDAQPPDPTVDAAAPIDAEVPYQPGDIYDELLLIDGISDVIEVEAPLPDYRSFSFVFEQPVDHDAPDGQTFGQAITLIHRDYAAPTILGTTGYSNYYGDYPMEPTLLLAGNQFIVEHRYFAGSTPQPPDWSKLRIWQAATDHHRIVEAFQHLYPGAWISTGASKGGMTSVYHRRFYPDDLDGTIAYVAPISFAAPDTRYQGFFDTVGTAVCRQRLRDFQRDALMRRNTLEPMAMAYADQNGFTFQLIGSLEAAFESDTAGFEWSFWQYMGDAWCNAIPGPGATDQEVFDFLNILGGVSGSSDQNLARFRSYYYQAEAELGYPGYVAAHVADLLIYEDISVADILPEPVTYDPSAMVDIADWVTTEGSELMFIYGEYDPWTAGAFELGGAQDSYLFTAPLANHGADILSLSNQDRIQAFDILETWTGVTPMIPKAAKRSSMPHREPRLLR